jgi:AP-2 complex subunit alpha
MTVPEPNIRYLALEAMTRVLVLPGADEALNDQLKNIIASLKDRDMSIRRRALDLLYLMCNYNNVGKIVEEMLNYTEETDMQIKEELVLKIAILAETFAPNLTWYIDVIVRLMSNSGDYITDDIWFRVIQIITGFGADSNKSL